MADGTATADRDESLYVRALQLRGLRKDEREADFVCSTEAIDSYGTILRQVWILDRFEANPVVLWAHRASELPVGHAIKIGVVNGVLQATVRFSTAEANPQAEYVWQSILQRALRGISVRFNARTITYEKIDGVDVVVFSDIELEELSVCSLPSNPETLVKLRERAMAGHRPHAVAADEHKSTAAERGAGEDNLMDEKDKKIAALETENAGLRKQVRDLDLEAEGFKKERSAVEKDRDDARTELKLVGSERDRLVQERDALKLERDKLESDVIEHDVEGLVGVKITAAEKVEFVELRKKDKSLFERIVAKRSDLKLTEQVIPSSKDDAPPPAVPSETSETRASSEAEEQAEWEALQKRALG